MFMPPGSLFRPLRRASAGPRFDDQDSGRRAGHSALKIDSEAFDRAKRVLRSPVKKAAAEVRRPLFYGIQPAARKLLTDLHKAGTKAGIFLRLILS